MWMKVHLQSFNTMLILKKKAHPFLSPAVQFFVLWTITNFHWVVLRDFFFHLSSSSYDGKLFSRLERIIFKLFRLWLLLANRPRAKRFVCRLWSSFVFRIAFPEYCKEHLVDYNYLKITSASLTQSVSQNVILTQNVIILANICKVRI